MSTQGLLLFQADFAAALASSDPAAHPQGLDGEAADRFRVYRNNFYHGVSQQLGEAYPVVRRLVGDAFFFAAARAFLDAHPPRTRSLALFGGEFPAFLEGLPRAASLPYLADVARLERSWLEALHAADAEPLAPAALTWLGEALAEVRFVAHPAARIVISDYPIVDLWRANQPEADASPRSFKAVAQSALLTRARLRVEMRALSPAQSAFARALIAGHAVAAAHETAVKRDAAFDVSAAFRELLAAGAFAQLELSTDEHPDRNDRSRAK